MAVQSPLFSFVSSGLDSGTFHVVRFRGQEGLSSLYRFEILLLSEDAEIDLGVVLNSAATFTIHAADGKQESPYHGVLEGFQQLQRVDEHVLYRAVLVPKLWCLTLTSHNQIFLGQTPQKIIATCLKDGGLLESDFDVRIGGKMDPWDYVCQYNESHFQFFSRWAERYGYYYYFDQSGTTEKLILTDTRMAHEKLRGQPVLDYADMSGLDALEADHVVKEFTMNVSHLPQKVKLKSYNYEKPDLDLQVEQEVDPQGRGEVYVYGQEFMTLEEGRKLASLHVEELQCRSRVFNGVSNIAFMTPGYIFTLRGHYRSDCNIDYLITSVEHEGAQEAWLSSGLGVNLAGNEDHPSYRNRFQCIPAAVQYRPSRSTVAPKIAGTLHAQIDAAGSGEYAELDAQGRYKVIMPFDLSGRKSGKASIWLRKAEPYAGSNHGMHFPLHKGTEVMIAFIDGDPNRPYILSAISNPNTPSVITDATQTQDRIITAGGNRLNFEDSAGKQNISLSTPTAGASIILGNAAPDNDPEDYTGMTKEELEARIEKIDEEIESDEKRRDELRKDKRKNKHEIDRLNQEIEDNQRLKANLESLKENAEGEEKFLGIGIKTGEKVKVEAGSYDSFLTGNEFKMIVGASEEVVLGAVESFVGVNESSFVAGLEASVVGADELTVVLGHSDQIVGLGHSSIVSAAKQELTIGVLTDIILGGVVEVHLPEKWEVSQTKMEIEEIKKEMKEQQESLAAEVKDLKGEHEELVENLEIVAWKTEELAESIDECAVEVSKVHGEVKKVHGEVKELNGEVEKNSVSISELAGTADRISSATSETSGLIEML